MLILFHISYSLFRDRKLRARIFMAFLLACSILAVLQFANLGGVQTVHESRASVLDANQNIYAWYLGIALLILLGILYRNRDFHTWTTNVGLLLSGVLIVQMVLTGSRAGFLAAFAGCCALFFGGNVRKVRFRNVVLVGIMTAAFLTICLHSDIIVERFNDSIRNGDLAERQRIFPAAAQMILEKPLLGWGTYEHLLELRYRVYGNFVESDILDTHNDSLFVLTEVGILGGVPFFIGLLISFKNVWQARKQASVALPFALMTSLAVMGLSGSLLIYKLFWLILAYANASYAKPCQTVKAPAFSSHIFTPGFAK